MPTIRTARADDLLAVHELLGGNSPVDDRDLGTVPGERYLLVLDAPQGGLAAAALLEVEDDRGHLAMLQVDPRFEGTGLEERFLGVVEAMCEAFGIAGLDVP